MDKKPPSLARRYCNEFSERPPEAFLEQLVGQEKEYGSQGVAEQLAVAHIYTDLAVLQPDAAESHLDAAKSYYDEIIQTSEQQIIDGCFNPLKYSSYLVRSILHTAEIPQWLQAVQRQTVTPNYEELLSAAQHALSYIVEWDPTSVDTRSATPGHYDSARSALVDFTAVLLGARAHHREQGGWLGRLALCREDGGLAYPGYNPNWDVGICLPRMQHTYIKPMRIQLYRYHKKQTQSYWAAGVMTLSEGTCGLYRPQYLINNCIREFDIMSSTGASTAPPSAKLDKLTNHLKQAILAANKRVLQATNDSLHSR